jgi:TonB family protein
MFSKLQDREIGAGIPSRALVLSLVLHSGVLVWLCWQPEPMLIQRASIMAGDNGSSLGMVYLPTDSSLRLPVNEESNKLKYIAVRKRSLKRRHTAPHQTDEHPTEAKVQAPSMGSPNGDGIRGSLAAWAARPALPLNFPDPHVLASELPPGVNGDVIVEVTIDAAGNITAKKVLQSIGYGIDEKVLAVLENWRFTPATILGRPVASRQDVHFHFPG